MHGGRDISTGILIYVSGRENLYRSAIDPAHLVGGKLSGLEILCKRFLNRASGKDIALVMPESMQLHELNNIAKGLGVATFFFDHEKVVEKPLSFCQQRWGLEDDTGCDEWVGAAIASPLEKLKWSEVILIPIENLLVEPMAVNESLRLFHHEGFEICFSGERQTGANWVIFKADVLKALMVNHEDIMWARGGLAWAVRKPLYPFVTGTFHCPRVRAKIQCDLRLNSLRTKNMYDSVFNEKFASAEFSYEEWLNDSNWERHYAELGPLVINVEPSAICQARCLSCPNSTLERKAGLMPVATVKKLVDGCAYPQESRFVFSGIGEPFLNPALSDMVAMTAESSSMLVTSLQKIPPDDFNYSALDQIRISVDALESKKFDQNRSGCSWKNIESFISLAASKKAALPAGFPEVGVTFVSHGENEGGGRDFLNYWKKVAKPVFQEHFFKWPFDQAPEKIQWFQILGENSFLGKIEKTSKIDFTPVRRRPCRHALLSVTILWDGSVTICPFDSEGRVKIGNIHERTLAEIWQSPEAEKIRASQLTLSEQDLPEICATCKDWYHNS